MTVRYSPEYGDFAADLVHFFGSRMGNDHDLLEELQEKYVKEEAA